MPPVVRHSKYDEAVAARLRQLGSAIRDDRDRATAALKVAIADLETLRRRCDAPVLQTLSAEYAACLQTLMSVDATDGDNLIDELERIKGRLRSGLEALATFGEQGKF